MAKSGAKEIEKPSDAGVQQHPTTPEVQPQVTKSEDPAAFHPADWIAMNIANQGDRGLFFRMLQMVRRDHGKAALLSLGEYLLRYAPSSTHGVLRIWIADQLKLCRPSDFQKSTD